MYVIESEVANFVPPPTLHHLTTAVTLIIISYNRQTGVCDSANWFGPIGIGWRIGGRVQDWTLCVRYWGRCTDVCETICVGCYCILPFPFLDLQCHCQASPFLAVIFSDTVCIDTLYVL